MITSISSLIFCLIVGIIKQLLHETNKIKKKRNKIIYLGKNKLDCIEMIISQSIVDLNISHEEFKMIMNEKKKIIMIKKNTINENKLTEA